MTTQTAPANATFSYQWIAGTTDISGATGSSYAPLVADLGKTIKVRVSFDDDDDNEETLTSEATATVIAAVHAADGRVPGRAGQTLGERALSPSTSPSSEPISISYKTLRDDSLEVTNGSATKAKRVNGQSDLWEITVEPDSDAAVDRRPAHHRGLQHPGSGLLPGRGQKAKTALQPV